MEQQVDLELIVADDGGLVQMYQLLSLMGIIKDSSYSMEATS